MDVLSPANLQILSSPQRPADRRSFNPSGRKLAVKVDPGAQVEKYTSHHLAPTPGAMDVSNGRCARPSSRL
jgi:hypothetical protein